MDCTSLKTLNAMGPFHPRTRVSIFRPFFLHQVCRNRLSPICSLSKSGSERSLPNGVGGRVSEIPNNRLLQAVLVSPQIPGNTGTIARTCAASAVGLHLVEPLGFQVDDTKLKRAGLDYWPHLAAFFGITSVLLTPLYRYVVVKVHSSWAEFREYFRQQDGEKRLLAFTKRGRSIHSDFSYRKGDWLIFGSETCGLPPEVLHDCQSEALGGGGGGGGTIRIPMVETYVRCLNLSVSVGIAVYEASRQLNYEQLQSTSDIPSVGSSKAFLTEDVFA